MLVAVLSCAVLSFAASARAADAPAGAFGGHERPAPPPSFGERHAVVEEPAWRRVVTEEPRVETEIVEERASRRRRGVDEAQPARWERRVYVRHDRRDYDAYQEPGPRGRWREEDSGW